MSQYLKINPVMMQAIRKQFDAWYAEQGGAAKSSNRRQVEQKIALAAMGDDDKATELGLSRDKRLKIKRDKKDKEDKESE